MAHPAGTLDSGHGAGVPKAKSWPYQRNPDRELSNVDPRNVRSFAHLEHQQRRAHKQRIAARNFIAWRRDEPETKPAKRQWLTCVVTTAIEIPAWALEGRFEGMTLGKQYVWFKGRPRWYAKSLVKQDRDAGGDPYVTTCEYRKCSRCGRILLALEAEDRRRLDESCAAGRQKPCGAECE
jgi:hypothetical protein